nr:uncharacterized protein LOC124495736 [Dermatophagoides farinae]
MLFSIILNIVLIIFILNDHHHIIIYTIAGNDNDDDDDDDDNDNRIFVPYKPTYGFPNQCNKIDSNEQIEQLRENYRQCQLQTMDEWALNLEKYYTETENFCCFVKKVLLCEQPILSECDQSYSELNMEKTLLLFDASCTQFDCEKMSTTDWIGIATAIIALLAAIVGVIGVCVKKFKQKNKDPLLVAKKIQKRKI